MGELLKCVAAEARTDELKTQLGSAFLTHTLVSSRCGMVSPRSMLLLTQ